VAQTLPPVSTEDLLEGRLTRPLHAAIRFHESRGLKYGNALDNLYAIAERTDEPYGEATRIQSGIRRVSLDSSFDYEGKMYYVQEYPLPCTILGWVLPTETEDAS
jgi:hypothetical protein